MKKTKPKIRIKKAPLICIVSTLITLLFIVIGLATDLPILDDNVEVKPDTELIYYLNVQYDGIDKTGLNSNDNDGKTIVNMVSNVIHVEDKIPEGLTFEKFVTTSDGTIGAESRSGRKLCPGKVVDDTPNDPNDTGVWNDDKTEYTYHGLHYDAKTRTVSFDVKNLQAGCILPVGIVTRTPATIDDPNTDITEIRRDFYNFATFKEDALSGKSNTVHAWMGKEDIITYKVEYKYEFEGDIPLNAPDPPELTEYVSGSQVGVASIIEIEGYTFSGWKTDDVTIEDGKFTMPEHDVTFKGKYTPILETYNVTYEIDGTIPDGYVVPTTKSYYQLANVKVDSLKKGDTFNGYRFLGWESKDIEISKDNDFVMPKKDVIITGKFEEVKYKVEYRFYDTVLPPNSTKLLPDTKEYKPGDEVALEQPKDANGYEFLGWYKDDKFIMPEEDVIIYGEWKKIKEKFAPTITKKVITTKDYYQPGDIVKYEITITNKEDFKINDVVIKENNKNAYFIEGNGYEVASSHYVKIDSINSKDTVTIYAEYKVTKNDKGTVINEAEITGALANNYELDLESETLKAEATFDMKSRIKIWKIVENEGNVDDVFQFNIKGDFYDSWMVFENNECGYVYVEPGKYKITEIISQDYSLKDIKGSKKRNGEIFDITFDNGKTLDVEFGTDYVITFTNKYEKYGFFHSVGRVVNRITDAVKG